MSYRLSPVLAACMLAGLGASMAAAQSAGAPSAPDDSQATTPAALAAHPQPAAPADGAADMPGPTRAISSQTAARLTAGTPAYAPPKPAAPKPDDDQADLGDTPKNEIIRLPDYVVRERPPPVFTQKEILTPKALAELEFKKHPGLNLWGFLPFSSLNRPIAIQMYDEEARLDSITDLQETANAIGRGGDTSQDEYIKRATQQTFMHDTWGSGDQNDGQ